MRKIPINIYNINRIKLLIYDNYINIFKPYNQVGIFSLEFLGFFVDEEKNNNLRKNNIYESKINEESNENDYDEEEEGKNENNIDNEENKENKDEFISKLKLNSENLEEEVGHEKEEEEEEEYEEDENKEEKKNNIISNYDNKEKKILKKII